MNIELQVQELLVKFPPARRNGNCLTMTYWLHVDGWPHKQKDFRHTTPVESILRAAREVYKRRPELSPTAYTDDMNQREKVYDLFTQVFPGITHESG